LKTGVKGPDGKILKDSVEVYHKERFFCTTGDQVPGTPPVIRNADLSFLYPADAPAVKPVADRLAELADGNRNNSFASLAGTLRNKGLKGADIYALLLPSAKEKGFPEGELRSICDRADGWAINASVQPNDDEDDTGFETFMKEIVPVDWVLRPFFGKAKIGLLVGVSGVNKTWMAIDLAIEAALGGAWMSRFKFNRPFRTWFIDQERDKAEAQRRFAALVAQKGLTKKDLAGKLDVKWEGRYKIDNDSSFRGFCKKLTKIQPELVVVDSLKTFHTKDINSQTDMQGVMTRINDLRIQFPSTTFVLVYHENKGRFQANREQRQVTTEHVAGATPIVEVPETVLIVDGQDATASTVYHAKSTIGPKHGPFSVRVRDVLPDQSQIIVEAK
jgi:hypothetical protein